MLLNAQLSLLNLYIAGAAGSVSSSYVIPPMDICLPPQFIWRELTSAREGNVRIQNTIRIRRVKFNMKQTQEKEIHLNLYFSIFFFLFLFFYEWKREGVKLNNKSPGRKNAYLVIHVCKLSITRLGCLNYQLSKKQLRIRLTYFYYRL